MCVKFTLSTHTVSPVCGEDDAEHCRACAQAGESIELIIN